MMQQSPLRAFLISTSTHDEINTSTIPDTFAMDFGDYIDKYTPIALGVFTIFFGLFGIYTRWANEAPTSPPPDSSNAQTVDLPQSLSKTPSDKTEALKIRILNHMNADHASSLSLFAQHYCKLPPLQAKTAKLTDIALDHMIISTSQSFTVSNRNVARNYIPITPPMSSFSEARERMVAMDNESLKGLGLSDITVTTYRLPRGYHWAVLFATTISFISFSRPELTDPRHGGFLYDFWSVNGCAPQLAQLAHTLQPYTFAAMVVIHTSEAVYLARTRLRKHGVKAGGALWYAWMVSCFLEGFGAFQRFDGIVEEKEEQKSMKKH